MPESKPVDLKSLSAVFDYTNLGFTVVPVNYRGKDPVTINKKQVFITEKSKAIEFFNSGRNYNIAVNLGPDFPGKDGCIVDIDLDNHMARVLAPYFLPKTRAVFGHAPSSPCAHYVYIVTSDPKQIKTIQNKNPDHKDDENASADENNKKAMLLELRASGYTVFPPSVHKSGEPIEWSANGNIIDATKITYEELLIAFNKLTAAVILSSYWCEGTREELAGSMSGMLAKATWHVKDAISFLTPIMRATKDDEIEQRTTFIQKTFDVYRSGGTVKGYKILSTILSKDALSRVVELLNIQTDNIIDETIEEFNKRYAQISEGTNIGAILDTDCASGIQLYSVDKFHSAHSGDCIKLGKKIIQKSKIWMDMDNNHRRKIKGIVFEPDGSPFDVKEGFFNCWKGFDLEPTIGDSHKPLVEHIFNYICRKDDKSFNWMMSWLGHIVQTPGLKSKTSLTLYGGHGSGKSIVGNYMKSIISPYFVRFPNLSGFTGKFNATLENKILVVIEESTVNKFEKFKANNFKALVDGEDMTIEHKGKDKYTVHNFLRSLSFSNDLESTPIEGGDRRVTILHVDDSKKDDLAYWAPIWDAYRENGPSDFMNYLMNYDVDMSLISRPITTKIRNEIINELMDPTISWIYEIACGRRLVDIVNVFMDKKEVYQDYYQYFEERKFPGVIASSSSILNAFRLISGPKNSDGCSVVESREKKKDGPGSYATMRIVDMKRFQSRCEKQWSIKPGTLSELYDEEIGTEEEMKNIIEEQKKSRKSKKNTNSGYDDVPEPNF